MTRIPRSENLTIEGPAGALEALVETPRGVRPTASAVICHPHPLQGGTMQNKVVHTLSRAFVAQGFAALRFNFRGVGGSEGVFDDGQGELQDALAAIHAARERVPDAPLWIAGFSFGAAVAIRAAGLSNASGLISVAPAVARITDDPGSQPQCPWLVIQGDQDELVDIDDTVAWINRLDPGPELRIIEGSTHFFHGKLVKLRGAAAAFIEAHAPSIDRSMEMQTDPD